MPIAVVCPGCSAKLNAPDGAAGKRVKCPKPGCGTAITIPAPAAEFEVVEDEPPAPPKKPAPAPAPKPKKPVVEVDEDEEEEEAPKKPAKKPARAVEDEDDEKPKKKAKARAAEDDEDDEDDRPTKKKKKQKGGLSPALIGAIAVGGVLLLGGVGYGIYALAFQKKEETAKPNPTPNPNPQPPGPVGPNPPQPPVPPGPNPPVPSKASIPADWVDFHSAQDKFKLKMPKQPAPEANGNGRVYQAQSDSQLWVVGVNVLEFAGVQLNDEFLRQLDDKAFESYKQGKRFTQPERKLVQYLGRQVTEMTGGAGFYPGADGKPLALKLTARSLIHNGKVYVILVIGPAEGSIHDLVFDSLELAK